MKKIISLALSLIIVISALGMVANADEVLSENQVRMGKNIIGTYSDDGKTLTVSGDGEMDNGDNCLEFKTKFKINENVEKVILEEGITSIAGCAFRNLEIKEIKIPDSVKTIDEYAFISCRNLENIDFGNGVEFIDYGAFYGCISLKQINLPKSLQIYYLKERTGSKYARTFKKSGLSYYAFGLCKSLESVNIGEINLGSDWAMAFSGCKKLKTVTVSKNNKYHTVKDNVVFNKKMTVLCYYPAGKPQKSYTVPSKVRCIDKHAFAFSKIKKIKLNNKLIKILSTAFQYSNLESITLPKSLKKIGIYAFSPSELRKVTILNTKNSIKFYKNDGYDSFESYKSKNFYLKFYVKNKKVAKELNKRLKGTRNNAKIYIGKKLIYKIKY